MKTSKRIVLTLLLIVLAAAGYNYLTHPTLTREVDFFLSSTTEISQCEPIYHTLQKKGYDPVFIVKPPRNEQEDKEHSAAITQLLDSKNLKYQKAISKNACCALATQRAYNIRHCKGMKLKMPYGAFPLIEDIHQEPEFTNGFDGFLVHGQFDIDHYKNIFAETDIHAIGIPKYDSFLKNPPSKELIKKKIGISETDTRKIITYLPTWGTHSSIDMLADVFGEHLEDYIILAKPHSNTKRYQGEHYRLELLENNTTQVLDASMTFEEICHIADLIITDIKSGASTEAMYLTQGKTPWIGVSAILPSSAYYPEVVAAGPLVQTPEQLHTAITNILENGDDTYQYQRDALNIYCYSNPSGPTHASEDAANTIIALSKEKSKMNLYPYWYHKLKRSIKKRLA